MNPTITLRTIDGVEIRRLRDDPSVDPTGAEAVNFDVMKPPEYGLSPLHGREMRAKLYLAFIKHEALKALL